MGNNVNLTEYLNLLLTITCPHCGSDAYAYFDDYDLDCHKDPQGTFSLSNECSDCENFFTVTAEFSAPKISISKGEK